MGRAWRVAVAVLFAAFVVAVIAVGVWAMIESAVHVVPALELAHAA